jgi:protein-S-isoprenylcysteine O-methyltransferase Ste14
MNRTIRFILGYITGGAFFLFVIPAGLYALSMMDYLFDYRMIIGVLAIRYVLAGVLLFIGVLFMIWSNIFLFLIGKGGPAEGFGVAISPRTRELVIKGPYRVCRHPMVFGLFLIYLSVVVYLNSYMGLIALILLLITASLYLHYSEEKRLLKDFGEEFLKYKESVPMIVPVKRRSKPAIQ